MDLLLFDVFVVIWFILQEAADLISLCALITSSLDLPLVSCNLSSTVHRVIHLFIKYNVGLKLKTPLQSRWRRFEVGGFGHIHRVQQLFLCTGVQN